MLSLFKLVGTHQTSPSHHVTTPVDNIITVSNFLNPQKQTMANPTHRVATPNHNLTQTDHIAVSPGLDREECLYNSRKYIFFINIKLCFKNSKIVVFTVFKEKALLPFKVK